MRLFSLALLTLSAITSASAGEFDADKMNNWHQWRGPTATGVAPRGNPPLEWSESKNVRWKVPIPGRSNATPIIWNDRVFVVTATPTDRVDAELAKPEDQPQRLFGIKYPNRYYEFVVMCLERGTGKTLWKDTAAVKVPTEGIHPDNTFASGSPTTDGERLYVWFGSQGLYCYDFDGNQLWKRDLGKVETRRSFNEGASPVVHDGKLILVRDQEGQSYITVLDARTGKDIWKKNRDEPSCWATPVVITRDGRTQVITNGNQRVRSYDLADGSLIWECGGQVMNVTPSPVALGDFVYCMSGYRGNSAMAIPVNRTGDLTDSDAIAWSISRGTPYVPSPLLYDDALYFNQSNQAIVSCLEAASGKALMDRQRLSQIRNIYASPVGAADRVYITGRAGGTVVMRHKSFEILATNKLDDRFDASPAIVGEEIFFRGHENLYCIGEKK